MLSNEEIKEIEKKIDYEFKDKTYLFRAFTHSSVKNSEFGDNEILELRGDGVLYSVTLDIIFDFQKYKNDVYDMYPSYIKRFFLVENNILNDEGFVSELRRQLICGSTLANCLEELDLARFLMVGEVDINDEIRMQESVKENLFEAIIGAVAFDCNDYNILKKVVKKMHMINRYAEEYLQTYTEKQKRMLMDVNEHIKNGILEYDKVDNAIKKEKFNTLIRYLNDLYTSGIITKPEIDLIEIRNENGKFSWIGNISAMLKNEKCEACIKNGVTSKKECANILRFKLLKNISMQIDKMIL